ncbi:unnamed protein product [Paramecium octaurelia]|uniref:Uncharacterized protein n=1 Tax=Paramecium octaurelia TaxID=43137 RepID=A0A8S1XM81_PAROT|nr:unnamed protein product [Paramecium octaurelia]
MTCRQIHLSQYYNSLRLKAIIRIELQLQAESLLYSQLSNTSEVVKKGWLHYNQREIEDQWCNQQQVQVCVGCRFGPTAYMLLKGKGLPKISASIGVEFCRQLVPLNATRKMRWLGVMKSSDIVALKKSQAYRLEGSFCFLIS